MHGQGMSSAVVEGAASSGVPSSSSPLHYLRHTQTPLEKNILLKKKRNVDAWKLAVVVLGCGDGAH